LGFAKLNPTYWRTASDRNLASNKSAIDCLGRSH
jgi:hypothetical protein